MSFDEFETDRRGVDAFGCQITQGVHGAFGLGHFLSFDLEEPWVEPVSGEGVVPCKAA